jgi:putative endonuclease
MDLGKCIFPLKNYFWLALDQIFIPMQAWTVYILKCSDNTYYTGCTLNLAERLKRHARGEVHYTKSRLPVSVETKIVFSDKYKAYDFEKYLKSGSGMAFRNERLLI